MKRLVGLSLLTVVVILSCDFSDLLGLEPQDPASGDVDFVTAAITDFRFLADENPTLNEDRVGTIGTDGTISVVLPFDAIDQNTPLVPQLTLEFPDLVDVNPTGAKGFQDEVIYTVESPDETRVYRVQTSVDTATLTAVSVGEPYWVDGTNPVPVTSATIIREGSSIYVEVPIDEVAGLEGQRIGFNEVRLLAGATGDASDLAFGATIPYTVDVTSANGFYTTTYTVDVRTQTVTDTNIVETRAYAYDAFTYIDTPNQTYVGSNPPPDIPSVGGRFPYRASDFNYARVAAYTGSTTTKLFDHPAPFSGTYMDEAGEFLLVRNNRSYDVAVNSAYQYDSRPMDHFGVSYPAYASGTPYFGAGLDGARWVYHSDSSETTNSRRDDWYRVYRVGNLPTWTGVLRGRPGFAAWSSPSVTPVRSGNVLGSVLRSFSASDGIINVPDSVEAAPADAQVDTVNRTQAYSGLEIIQHNGPGTDRSKIDGNGQDTVLTIFNDLRNHFPVSATHRNTGTAGYTTWYDREFTHLGTMLIQRVEVDIPLGTSATNVVTFSAVLDWEQVGQTLVFELNRTFATGPFEGLVAIFTIESDSSDAEQNHFVVVE